MTSPCTCSSPRPKVGFIGAGKVGTALALALSRACYPVVAVASRSLSSAQRLAEAVDGCSAFADTDPVVTAADLVFVTVPDDAIAEVAGAVAWRPGQMVVHCSGSLSAEVLDPARRIGALVGGLHPLQTFADARKAADALAGSAFGLEAEDTDLAAALRQMVEALDGTAVVLRAEDKPLYHAAAVVACNYLVTLFSLATGLWDAFGVAQPDAARALLPLVRGTLANLETVGLPAGLTGPIARGDVGTVRKHLAALQSAAPELLPVYRELGLRTIPIGRGKGTLNETAAGQLRRLLGEIEGESCE